MVTLEALTKQLEATHGEILQVRGEVVEALRSFYAGASSISAEDAIRIASKWMDPPPHLAFDSSSLKDPISTSVDSELQIKMQRLNESLLDTVAQLQLTSNSATAEGPEKASNTSEVASTKLVVSFTQRERLKRQMEQSKRMIVLIEKLTEIDRLFYDMEEHMDHLRLVAAAKTSVAVRKALDLLHISGGAKEAPSPNTAILEIIELEHVKRKNRLLCKIKELHACMIVWKDGALKIVKSQDVDMEFAGQSTSDVVREFWGACEIMGELTPKFTELAKSMAQHIFKPLLQQSNVSLTMTRDANGPVLTFAVGAGSSSSDLAEVELKLKNVLTALSFLHTELLMRDNSLMEQFGELMWMIPGNLEAQLMGFLQDKIPQDTSALGTYRDVVVIAVNDLENQAIAIGFKACSNSQLRVFSTNITELYSKKRRQHILTNARGLMSGGYHDSVKVAGAIERCNLDASVDSSKKGSNDKHSKTPGGNSTGHGDDENAESGGSFRMPDYRISTCAHGVMELAHQTLIEACAGEAMCANLLFQTSRDIIFLFKAVVQTLYEDDIANDARACMLYHNDCLYIAHHMITIGHQYKRRLPSPLNQTATMIDMVPSFREAGETALTTFAKSQTDEVVTRVKSLPSFSELESDHTMHEVEEFIRTALYKLNRLSTFWKEGLPDLVYNKIMGLMLQPLIKNIVEHVLKEPKISAHVGTQLHHLLSLLLECESLFDSTGQAEKYVSAMSRLQKLSTLMMEPIATVRGKFQDGALSDFSSQELVGLITALFRESSERKELLHLIITS